MRGFPKHLNTKTDYIYVKNNFPAEQWRPVWQELLDNRFSWFKEKELADEASGITDETHKVFIEEDPFNPDAPKKYWQMIFIEDVHALIFRLGFTVDEVEKTLREN